MNEPTQGTFADLLPRMQEIASSHAGVRVWAHPGQLAWSSIFTDPAAPAVVVALGGVEQEAPWFTLQRLCLSMLGAPRLPPGYTVHPAPSTPRSCGTGTLTAAGCSTSATAPTSYVTELNIRRDPDFIEVREVFADLIYTRRTGVHFRGFQRLAA